MNLQRTKTNDRYYAQLLAPFSNKYGHIIPINKRFWINEIENKNDIEFYESREGRKLPDVKSELDYVSKCHKILVWYGRGAGEYEVAPCKLFKLTTVITETVKEI